MTIAVTSSEAPLPGILRRLVRLDLYSVSVAYCNELGSELFVNLLDVGYHERVLRLSQAPCTGELGHLRFPQ